MLVVNGVKTAQKKYIPKNIRNLLKGKEKSYTATIRACQNPRNPTLLELEEIILLLFFSLTDADLDVEEERDSTKKSPRRKSKQDESAAEIIAEQERQRIARQEEIKKSPVYAKTVQTLKSQGFTVEPFIHKVAAQKVLDSASKKANEVYSWGDIIRKQDEKLKKRQIAGIAGLGVLSGALFLSAVPMVAVAPPLALVPLGLAVGVGGAAATKATPGGLVSIVAGCLQQRILLASHHVLIDDYFSSTLQI